MHRWGFVVIWLSCLTAWPLASAGKGAVDPQWSRFRGPNGSGRSLLRLPEDWETRAFRWQAQLPGIGHASPVVWGRRLFVTSGGEATGDRILECRDTRSGEVHWSRRYSASVHRKHKLNSFASSTPAVDERHVYWGWATPEALVVTALDHQGTEIWKRDLGPFKSGHGGGVSPIVYGELLVLPSEHQGDSTLYALDRRTGLTRWKIGRDSKSHYSTPCVFAPADGAASLIFTNWRQGVTAVDPRTGEVRWQADVFDKGHVESSIGSPVVSGDLVIGVCGWLGYGNEVIAVRAPTDPAKSTETEFTETETGIMEEKKPRQAWRIQRAAPLCTTPLVKDELVFLWSDAGIVTCAEVADGEVAWRERLGGTCYASPICLGDTMVNVTADGELIALDAARMFRQRGRRKLGEPSHSTPAVADGMLFIRTFSQLFALPLQPPK